VSSASIKTKISDHIHIWVHDFVVLLYNEGAASGTTE